MESTENRLRRLEDRIADLNSDLRVLRTLVEQDHGSALNKIRYVTEKVLHRLCTENDVSWGKAEPTLENMIGPLIAGKLIPKDVALHVRTVQTNASPGSHYQEAPLSSTHVQLAQIALLEFLEWYYRGQAHAASAVVASAPRSSPRSRVGVGAALALGGGIAVVAALVLARGAERASRAPVAPAPSAAPSASSAPSAATTASLREPSVGLAAIEVYAHPTGATVGQLDSTSRWESAQRDFAEATQQPGVPARWRAGALFADAQAKLAAGDVEGAVTGFGAAAKEDTAWALPQAGLAVALSTAGRYAEALDAAREAEHKDPSWPGAVRTLATVYARKGQLPDAIQEYQRALAMVPGDAVLLGYLALAFHASRLDSEAERYGKMALDAYPDLVTVRLMFAERALERSDGHEALTQAERAVAADPRSWGPLLAEADALTLVGRKEEALAAYRAAFAARRPNEAHTERLLFAMTFVDKGQLPPPRVSKKTTALPQRTSCTPGDPLCTN
jgi:tetratricopeptide (TPR) repeat protein